MSGSVPRLEQASGRQRAEREVVRHQRVHAVDGDELLGERIRRRVMVGLRSDDAAEELVVVEELEHVLQVLAGEPGPVHVHRHLDRSGCGTMAGVHSTVWILAISAELISFAFAKSCSSFQVGLLVREQIADVVVLEREQRVEHGQPDPPVVGEPGEVDAGLGIDRQQARRLDAQLAADAGAQLGRRLRDRSRRSATRPTSGCSGWRRPAAASTRRAPASGTELAARGSSARPSRRPAGVGMSIVVGLRALVHEPVVHHELDPRRRPAD